MDVTLIMDRTNTDTFIETARNLLPEATFGRCKCKCNTVLVRLPTASYEVADGESLRIVDGVVVNAH